MAEARLHGVFPESENAAILPDSGIQFTEERKPAAGQGCRRGTKCGGYYVQTKILHYVTAILIPVCGGGLSALKPRNGMAAYQTLGKTAGCRPYGVFPIGYGAFVHINGICSAMIRVVPKVREKPQALKAGWGGAALRANFFLEYFLLCLWLGFCPFWLLLLRCFTAKMVIKSFFTRSIKKRTYLQIPYLLLALVCGVSEF